MKKIFILKEEHRAPERVLESVKHEIRKYIKREYKKKLPENATYWEFDCRFGNNADNAELCISPELIKALDKAAEEQWEQCYVEILARPVTKAPKVVASDANSERKTDAEQD